ncbi:uncharacterized protein LOC144327882 [Podarcis muralis]
MAPKKASRKSDPAITAKRPIKGPSQALRSPQPGQSLQRVRSMVSSLAGDPVALARMEAELDGLMHRRSTPSTSSVTIAPPVDASSPPSSSSEGEGELLPASGYSPDVPQARSPVPPVLQVAMPRGRVSARAGARKRAPARGLAVRGLPVQPAVAGSSTSGHSQAVSFQSLPATPQQGDASESSVEDSLPLPPKTSSGGHRRHKRSSRRRAKRRRRDTSSSSSGRAAIRIWIVGHSIVHWAADRARQSGLGDGLGFPQHVHVSWISRRGMLWREFLPLMRRRVFQLGPPTAIVVQLGENDMVSSSCYGLRAAILQDLGELAALVPSTKLIWSQLLQRRIWRGSPCPAATERVRKRINSAASKLVVNLGGSVIPHPLISFKATEFYRDDGVHLSPVGNDVWLDAMVSRLRVWLNL